MSKYYSKKVKNELGVFDSKKEYSRYLELLTQLKNGEITNLDRQVRYQLLPSQRIEGKVIERPIYYIADFVYEKDKKCVVEDVKGYRTTEYKIKRKLMLYIHGIRIREI